MPAERPPAQDPGQNQLVADPIQSPYSALWWVGNTITNIPEESVGWLVAAGWQITDIFYDTTMVPPVPYFSMAKQVLQTPVILAHLLNSYTTAHNVSQLANEVRYNQVVVNWTELINSSQQYFQTQADEQNTHVALYHANLDQYMSDVSDLIAANRTQLVNDAAVATAALGEMETKLDDLETNANANATTISGLLTSQASYLSTFLTDFAAKLTELDDNYTAHLTKIEEILTDAEADLSQFAITQAAELGLLKTAYSNHVATIESLLTTAAGYLSTISGQVDSILTSMDSDYTDVDSEITALLTSGTTALGSYADDYNSVLAKLKTDYEDHEIKATNLLESLGATELTRINEQFNASLANQVQQLTDRGHYSSGEIADITARNTRDRNEEIAALNDRLNLRKWENQHRLYEQKVAMRTGTMAGTDRVHAVRQEIFRYQASQITGLYQSLQSLRDRTLNARMAFYGLQDANARLNIDVQSGLYNAAMTIRRLLIEEATRLHALQQALSQWEAGQRDTLLVHVQQVEAQHLAGIDKQHAAQQEVSRVAMAERDTLLSQLQEAVKGIIVGQERYATLTMQNASTLAEHKHKMILEKMNEYATRLEELKGTHTENMKLMAYQLDERNKLLVSLYGFVERREDIGPSFKDLSEICVALGDSGGGWITP